MIEKLLELFNRFIDAQNELAAIEGKTFALFTDEWIAARKVVSDARREIHELLLKGE